MRLWGRLHLRPRRPSHDPRPVDADVVERVIEQHPVAPDMQAPDLTHRVMGRLGYMKASPAVAARRRRQRWISRGLLACGLLMFGAGVVALMPALPGARAPHATTMPAAVERSFDRHQEQADRTLEVIRGLLIQPTAAPPDRIGEEPEMRPTPPAGTDQPSPNDEIAPDVDRSAIAAVRWL